MASLEPCPEQGCISWFIITVWLLAGAVESRSGASLAVPGAGEGWPQECLAMTCTQPAQAHGRVFGYSLSQGGSGGP